MEILVAVAVALLVALWVSKVKRKINFFLENFDLIIAEKEDVESIAKGPKDALSLKPANYDSSIDLRGTPTHLCPCGSHIWNVKVVFEDYEIATYFLDMECVSCGSVATAPTPVDKMGNEQ
jgi:hypothetical protein